MFSHRFNFVIRKYFSRCLRKYLSWLWIKYLRTILISCDHLRAQSSVDWDTRVWTNSFRYPLLLTAVSYGSHRHKTAGNWPIRAEFLMPEASLPSKHPHGQVRQGILWRFLILDTTACIFLPWELFDWWINPDTITASFSPIQHLFYNSGYTIANAFTFNTHTSSSFLSRFLGNCIDWLHHECIIALPPYFLIQLSGDLI